nr:hypothetical protein [Cressdnaviricota sp.]
MFNLIINKYKLYLFFFYLKQKMKSNDSKLISHFSRPRRRILWTSPSARILAPPFTPLPPSRGDLTYFVSY